MVTRSTDLVSSQSFPQLCKNLLKMRGFWVCVRYWAYIYDTFSRRKSLDHGLKPLFAVLTEFTPVLPGFDEAKALRSR
jgi:hypothetical protein